MSVYLHTFVHTHKQKPWYILYIHTDLKLVKFSTLKSFDIILLLHKFCRVFRNRGNLLQDSLVLRADRTVELTTYLNHVVGQNICQCLGSIYQKLRYAHHTDSEEMQCLAIQQAS